jgi:hypothetical protein
MNTKLTKLLLAVVVVAATSATTTVWAAEKDSPGQTNQYLKEVCGTPGQNYVGLPAWEFAQERNDYRKGGPVNALRVMRRCPLGNILEK